MITEVKGFNPTNQQLIDIDRMISQYETEKSELTATKKIKEGEMFKIKNEIRAGGILNDSRYKSICSRQNVLIKEISEIQRPINSLKLQIRQKLLMKSEISEFLDNQNPSNTSDVIVEINALIAYYQDFSTDATRVSSTRIMAGKFVKKLDGILKSL